MDFEAFARAVSHPGIDPRIWVSYATVAPDTEDDKAVRFVDGGVLVRCVLHPSGHEVTCRCAAEVAGNGESEYSPLLAGDEVLVVIPQGDMTAPPVLIKRLNNALDPFPERVAGKETKLNNFAFRRVRTPVVLEVGGDEGSYLIRSAKTEAMIGIDSTGNLTVRDGEGTALQFGPSGFALQDKDANGQIVLNHEEGSVSIWWGSNLLKINNDGVTIMSAQNIVLGSSSAIPTEHLTSAESMVTFVNAVLTILRTALSGLAAVPVVGGGGGTCAVGPALATLFDPTTVLPAAVPATTTIPPALLNAITTALLTPKAQGVPGIGCAGITVG